MIETDKFVAYDTNGHYYYLTEAGIAEYVIDGEELIKIWNKPSKRAQLQGKLLHQALIRSPYNARKPRFRHRDFVEYMIFKNEEDERELIIEALTNFAEVVSDSELDRDILDDTRKFPQSILDPLRTANLYFKGRINFEVPEDEYREDY